MESHGDSRSGGRGKLLDKKGEEGEAGGDILEIGETFMKWKGCELGGKRERRIEYSGDR